MTISPARHPATGAGCCCPLLGPVTSTGYTDRLHVRLVPGQSAADFAGRGRQPRARVRRAWPAGSARPPPGAVLVELVRRDALAAIIPALPVPGRVDLRARRRSAATRTAHRG